MKLKSNSFLITKSFRIYIKLHSTKVISFVISFDIFCLTSSGSRVECKISICLILQLSSKKLEQKIIHSAKGFSAKNNSPIKFPNL